MHRKYEIKIDTPCHNFELLAVQYLTIIQFCEHSYTEIIEARPYVR